MNNTDIQQRAINKLSRLKVGALFMEMGTGKTKVALDLMRSKVNKCDLFLWICPCSLKNEIENERQKWQPQLNITVVGCESIGMSSRIYLETREKLEQAKCAFIVVDESLKIKNIKAQTTQRILDLSKYSSYRLILNGTPLSKNCLDLYTQFQFLSPLILPEKFHQFKRTYCEFYTKGERKGKVKRQHNIPHLISRIKPYIFDAKLELKVDGYYHDYTYEMDGAELMEYEEIKCEMLDALADCDNSDISFFALSSRLQNYYAGCDSKHQALQELIRLIDDKVIIFCKFLSSIPAGALRVTGDMNMTQRAEAIAAFKADQKVLYITYGCGAFGLNLQFCKNMIFADGTFNYAERLQAEARIYRLGQESNVSYYSLKNASVGLEKIIYRCLDKKEDMLSAVKKEISKLDEKGKLEWLKKHL